MLRITYIFAVEPHRDNAKIMAGQHPDNSKITYNNRGKTNGDGVLPLFIVDILGQTIGHLQGIERIKCLKQPGIGFGVIFLFYVPDIS